MANTGNIVVTERDMNPNSSTYNETRTRTYQDLTRCPISTDPDWVVINWTCEQQDGYRTGRIILTKEDMNPNSPSYGQVITVTESGDPRCERNTEPNWIIQSMVCQMDSAGNNNGYADITELDVNPWSPTYNTTRTRTQYDFDYCHSIASGTKLYAALIHPNVSETPKVKTVECNGNSTLEHAERKSFGNEFYIVVGDCVTKIADDCYKASPTPPTLGANAFMCRGTWGLVPECDIYVPAESLNAYKNATGWSLYADRIQSLS